MRITMDQAQREIVQFGLEEMRNRGIEVAARYIERAVLGHGERLARDIRELKRDPAAKLSDWWGSDPAPYEYETPWC